MAIAQVTSDGTVNTQVTTDGNVDEITGGETRGDNLFHSFQDFSVPTNNEAFFNNASDIANIFSRVTGGNISNIDGLIRANGSANLFLVNPNGILFGENASLDIGGSFYGSTADSILFEEGEYSATDLDSPPLLTINAPIGLNFRNEPGEIINRSVVQRNNNAGEIIGLEVSPRNNLTLVGGDINLEGGNLTATGGRIELGGLSQAGTVTFNGDGSLSFPTDVARADITFSNAAEVDVTGTGGGDIAINARNLTLEAGELGKSRTVAGIRENSTDLGAQAGDITINATDNVTVDRSIIINSVDFGVAGNGGDITITADTFSLTNGGGVNAGSGGAGDTGLVQINASDTISIGGERSLENSGVVPSRILSTVDLEATGDSQGIAITTKNLHLTNGGSIIANNRGLGNAGSVQIKANDTIVIDGETSVGQRSGIFSRISRGGRATAKNPQGTIFNSQGIDITTENLSLDNGGEIGTSTSAEGNPGLIKINAGDTININGEDLEGTPSAIFSAISDGGTGTSQGITITTKNLVTTNGGQVSGSVFDGGSGNAGSVRINASDTISIDGETSNSEQFSGVFSAVTSRASGNSQDVIINAGSLTITNGGRIDASVEGQGNAGEVKIEANSISLDGDNATISSSTSSGNGGIVNLSVASTITLDNNSSISAEAFEEADGGDLSIDAEFIVAFPNGSNDIIASAEQGNGGNINIDAESIFGIQERLLSATTNDINASSSVSGLDGTVNITTLDINPIEGATEIPSNLVVPEQTTEQACQSNREAEAKNGLTIEGKGGVPPAPELPLNSLNTTIEGEYTDSISATPQPIKTSRGLIQPARGIKKTENGIVLTAYPTNNQGDRLPEIKPNCGI